MPPAAVTIARLLLRRFREQAVVNAAAWGRRAQISSSSESSSESDARRPAQERRNLPPLRPLGPPNVVGRGQRGMRQETVMEITVSSSDSDSN